MKVVSREKDQFTILEIVKEVNAYQTEYILASSEERKKKIREEYFQIKNRHEKARIRPNFVQKDHLSEVIKGFV
jgi:hypothetical protein